MLEQIIIGVAVAAVLGGLAWAVQGVVLMRPRLEIRYTPLDGQSFRETQGVLNVRWGYSVAIVNMSPHDALDVRVAYSNNPQIQQLPEPHVKAMEKIAVRLNLVKPLDLPTVVAVAHDFHGRLEPPELKNLAITLQYKNRSGVRFFTRYRRVDGRDTNKYSLLKGRGRRLTRSIWTPPVK